MHNSSLSPLLRTTLIAFCAVLIVLGITYRFVGIDWNQSTNLHPDEYGLTNTLTQLRMPDSLADYWNTRISPISPYQKYDENGKATMNGPDNRMRWGQWPIIILRGLGELTGNTGYNEIRIMGRYVTALLDTLAVLLILLIGERLYNLETGALAAALSALAVMQIQQSHFMTVDNFAVFFTAATMYSAVRIAQSPHRGLAWLWYALFGVTFGMTLTSKINLLPLGGMVLIAAFLQYRDAIQNGRKNLAQIVPWMALGLVIAGIATLLTFRVTQPMTFRAATGDTGFFTVHLNQDWFDSMKVAQQESSGIGGGPPAEQWAGRTAIIFPLMNMVVWGMGIPLGIAAWIGWAAALWQMLRQIRKENTWFPPAVIMHALPVIWVGGYFFFMGTRWVTSIRYFLPIYPFLCLLAAWGILTLINRQIHPAPQHFWRAALAISTLVIVTLGTAVWATAFTRAVYEQDHTRIQATEWIFEKIPGPMHIQMVVDGQTRGIPIPAPQAWPITADVSYQQQFTPQWTGALSTLILPHVSNITSANSTITILISTDPDGTRVLDQAVLQIPPTADPRGMQAQAAFHGSILQAHQTYYLNARSTSSVTLYHNIVSIEDWDEGVPIPLDGYDPFGTLYQGVTMQVRWGDSPDKRQMYLNNLAMVDYIILPSQRSIWSISRLPRMYPMTIAYYRALFDGSLGFDQIAVFQAPWKIGPLQISDAGGVAAWNKAPTLPRFNFNFFAAEEAFTVYDHPPVWVFQKRADFSLSQVQAILNSVDLSSVVIQTPHDTKVVPIP